MSGPEFTVATWNVKKKDGRRNWTPFVDTLLHHAPNVDVLCVQELDGGKKKASDPLDTSQADSLASALGMNIRLSDSPTTVHTAIAWRPDLQVLNEFTLDREVAPFSHHGQSLVQLKDDEWPHPVTFASAHLSPFSATLAVIEAQYLIAHLDMWGPEEEVVVAGDVNGPADGDPHPPWEELPARDVAARARPQSGPPVANTDAAHVLRLGRLVDAAAEVADRTGDLDLRFPTGKGQLRVDRIYRGAAFDALLADHIPSPLSDHHLVITTLRFRKEPSGA